MERYSTNSRRSSLPRRSLARKSTTSTVIKNSRPSNRFNPLASSTKVMQTPAQIKKPDPRKLNDKKERQLACSNLYKFLIEKNYKGGSLKKKDLTSISSRLFQETFDFLARHVDPNWRARHPENAKLEDCMLNFLRQLEYPFEITRSKLKDAVPANYPQLTGVLCWLADLVKYIEYSIPFVDHIVENCSDELKKVKQNYFRECYEEFMDNEDEPFEQVELRVEKRLESLRQNVKEEVKEVMRENKDIEGNMKILKQEEAKFQKLATEVEDMKARWTGLKKYFEEMEAFLPRSREKVELKENECKSLQADIESEKKKLAQLKSDVCCQQYSKKDMEKFKQQLLSHQENNQDLQQRIHVLQEQQKKELPKILKAESVYERLKVDCDENLESLFRNSTGIIPDEHCQKYEQFLIQNSQLSIDGVKQMLLKHASKFVDNVHFGLEDEHKKVKKNVKKEENKLSQETYKCERLTKELVTCQQEKSVEESIEKELQRECGRIDDDESYTNNNYKTRGNVCNIDDLKLQLKQLQTKYEKREKERKLKEAEKTEKLKNKFENLVENFNKEYEEMLQAEKDYKKFTKDFCDEKKREIDEVEEKHLRVDRMTEEVMKKEAENKHTLEGLDEQIKRADELVMKIESM